MTTSNQRLTAKIYGRVQGVGFRVFVQEKARSLGLKGYVRNKYSPQRHVLVVAEGPANKLKTLLHYLEQGPSLARVERIDVKWSQATNEFSKFGIG